MTGVLAAATPTFTHYERRAPTLDSPTSFWIACDESGQDGESLLSAHPVMSHGTVRLDDNDAEAVVAELRRRLASTQGAELKSARFNAAKTVAILASALDDPDLLAGRCSVQVVDKRYTAVAKIIDLIVEEYEHNRGADIYSSGEAKTLAADLLTHGPKALGEARFDALVGHFVSLFRMGEPAARARSTVDELFDCLTAAVAAARTAGNRRVESILERVARGREEVDFFIEEVRGSDGLPHLQPLIPALIESIRFWDARLRDHGRVMVLHDRQNLLSDQMIAVTRRGMRYPSLLTPVRPDPVLLGAFVRGDSKTHPSIQLADLVAGAGRIAGEYALGRRTDPVAKQLSQAVRPLVAAGSLWGDPRSWKSLTSMPY
jgi:hypothetical protein